MPQFITKVLMGWFNINKFINVPIDSNTKSYADTLSSDEEFYIMANKNTPESESPLLCNFRNRWRFTLRGVL